MECHSQRGVMKRFENNETMEVFVSFEDLNRSVHKNMECKDCHYGYEGGRHPEKVYKCRDHFRTRMNISCKRCHEKELRGSPIHMSVLKEDGTHLCTNCHSAHGTLRINVKNILREEERFCAGCHIKNINMRFLNGESISIVVHIADIMGSVHRNLSCSDCHFGFTRDEHPQRKFRTLKDFRITHSEACRRCHFDKYIKFIDSIHFREIGKGNFKAPVCIDCHGSHYIKSIKNERRLIVARCSFCHSEIFETYKMSVHGDALINEKNTDVPLCIDCHTSHTIEDPLTSDYREKIPSICGNCHSDEKLMSMYGLSPNVVMTYLSDFHGVTLEFYKKQKDISPVPLNKAMATCTDCHGTHDIRSFKSGRTEDIKSNLSKKCQRCHVSAPVDFPEAWISHYIPDIKKYPVLFIIEMLYRIFIPSIIIGLFLQIILHIWRYSVNR